MIVRLTRRQHGRVYDIASGEMDERFIEATLECPEEYPLQLHACGRAFHPLAGLKVLRSLIEVRFHPGEAGREKMCVRIPPLANRVCGPEEPRRFVVVKCATGPLRRSETRTAPSVEGRGAAAQEQQAQQERSERAATRGTGGTDNYMQNEQGGPEDPTQSRWDRLSVSH